MRIQIGITLDAPPDTAWHVIEAIEHHVDWMADAETITFVGDQRRGVGTVFDCVTRIGPFRTTDRMTVTAWEPPSVTGPPAVMGIEHQGLFTGTGRFTLRDMGAQRTRFTWTEELHFPIWFGGSAGAFVAKPVLQRVWRANLARLARLVASAR